jgi:hypothetical protein
VQVNLDIQEPSREYRIVWNATSGPLAPGAEVRIHGCGSGAVSIGEIGQCRAPDRIPRQIRFYPDDPGGVLRAVFRSPGASFELTVRNTGSAPVDAFTLLYVE